MHKFLIRVVFQFLSINIYIFFIPDIVLFSFFQNTLTNGISLLKFNSLYFFKAALFCYFYPQTFILRPAALSLFPPQNVNVCVFISVHRMFYKTLQVLFPLSSLLFWVCSCQDALMLNAVCEYTMSLSFSSDKNKGAPIFPRSTGIFFLIFILVWCL